MPEGNEIFRFAQRRASLFALMPRPETPMGT